MKLVPTLATVAIVLAGGYAGWHYWGGKPADDTAPPPPPVPVSVAMAKDTEVAIYLRGIGTVTALNAIEIHPQVGGVLTDLPVREGQEVKTGDVIAIIDPRPLKAALDRAIAQRTQDQADLHNAIADQSRYAALARRDFASRQQLDTQTATVAKLQGAVAADNASIETATINLGYSVVHSPIDGQVSLRRVDPGNLIQANATGPGIVSIQQVHPISVVFTLPEKDLPQVKAAQAKGDLPVLADSSDGQLLLATGTLLTANNAIDTGTGTINFRAKFGNKNGELTPGQFVSVRLQVGIAKGVAVPHGAVQHGQDGLSAYTVGADKKASRHAVKILYDNGTVAVLTDGVKDGDQVVTSGQSRIGPGTALAFKDPSDPAPPADQSASR